MSGNQSLENSVRRSNLKPVHKLWKEKKKVPLTVFYVTKRGVMGKRDVISAHK